MGASHCARIESLLEILHHAYWLPDHNLWPQCCGNAHLTIPLTSYPANYTTTSQAWGAMLFFLLLKAAPAMNHPSADDDNSPRKIWLEIDSQILNALFCVTGFGLAPWRFRDFYWLKRVIHFHDHAAMRRLTVQNKAWFRPSAEYADALPETTTFTGQRAPPTPIWKLAFTVDMMVINTLLQAVLCYFMWGYNRLNRPSWATGESFPKDPKNSQ